MNRQKYRATRDRFDDSSTGSECSEAAGPTNRSSSFVKLSSIPSMYSKAADDDEDDDPEASSDASTARGEDEGLERDRPPRVSDEMRELFQLVDAYEPVDLDIETPLRCFFPAKMFVAVGEADPCVKVPRPDGVADGRGAALLDEPLPAARQSDPAAIELGLRNRSRKARSGAMPVRGIEHALSRKREIERWIGSVEEVSANKPSPEVTYRNDMPSTEEVARPWPREIKGEIESGDLELPGADIDLNVEEYARAVCSLLDVPVHEGCVLESAHALFRAFAELPDTNAPRA